MGTIDQIVLSLQARKELRFSDVFYIKKDVLTMNSFGDDPIEFLMNVTKEVSSVLKQYENELPETVSRIDRQMRIITSWLVRLEGEREFPQELQEVLAEIRSSVENVKTTLIVWGKKYDNRPSWAKWIGPSKQIIVTLAPATALSLAMLPGGAIAIIVLLITFAIFLYTSPTSARNLQEAWAIDNSLQQFRDIEADLREQAKQLRHLAQLRLQIKKERKYDVSKVLEDPASVKFWCTNFGMETSSVPTDRFLEAILSDSPIYERCRRDARLAICTALKEVLDSNDDGVISPQEMAVYLQSFGPLEKCVERTVGSVLDLTTSPPSRCRWFFYKKLDRRAVEEYCPKQGVGTFCIRAASSAGEFALSYVKADKRVVHLKILNSPDGFHFENAADRFSTLAKLVAANSDKLLQPYVDFDARVVLNIGGRKFESAMGTFMDSRHSGTLLGRVVSAGQAGQELFFDRDPDAFAVILNWYRTGELMVPATVPLALLNAELNYFGVQAQLPPPSNPATPLSKESAAHPPLSRSNSVAMAEQAAGTESPLRNSAQDTAIYEATGEEKHRALHKAATEPIIQPHLARPSTPVNMTRLVELVPYFHGPIDEKLTAELLEGAPAGSYLARNSKSNPSNCVILSYMSEAKQVTNLRLWKLNSGKYCLNNPPTAKDTLYESVAEFVDGHPKSFKQPILISSQSAYEATSS